MNNLPLACQYIAGCCTILTAFFMFTQVTIYASKGHGWLDRPWYIQGSMFCVSVAFVYAGFAYWGKGELFTTKGFVLSVVVCAWQFVSLYEVVTRSYKVHSAKVMERLFAHSPGWKRQPAVYTEQEITRH